MTGTFVGCMFHDYMNFVHETLKLPLSAGLMTGAQGCICLSGFKKEILDPISVVR